MSEFSSATKPSSEKRKREDDETVKPKTEETKKKIFRSRYVIDEEAFNSKASQWKASSSQNISDGELMLEYTNNCALVYEQAFGRLFLGGQTRFVQQNGDVKRDCNAMEFRHHTDAILRILWNELKVDPFCYTSGEAVMFLYMYSEVTRYWERTKIDGASREDRRRYKAEMNANLAKITETVANFEDERQDELPTGKCWWVYVHDYLVENDGEFSVEKALKIGSVF